MGGGGELYGSKCFKLKLKLVAFAGAAQSFFRKFDKQVYNNERILPIVTSSLAVTVICSRAYKKCINNALLTNILVESSQRKSNKKNGLAGFPSHYT